MRAASVRLHLTRWRGVVGLCACVAAFLFGLFATMLMGRGSVTEAQQAPVARPSTTASATPAIAHVAPSTPPEVGPTPRPRGVPAEASLAIPAVGTRSLRVISPSVVEISSIDRDPPAWEGLTASAFHVACGKKSLAVKAVGFHRRPLYAPDRTPDLRIASIVDLRLASEIPSGVSLEVSLQGKSLQATADPLRLSPALHVNQEGYAAAGPKIAMVGQYLGPLGELKVANLPFALLDGSGATVFRATLRARPDGDFGLPMQPYREVAVADFTAFRRPGRYRLAVAGLGTSYPFFIDDAIGADYTRTYALGIYHQRCGAANVLPFTRFVHAACHMARAQIPDATFKSTQEILSQLARDRDASQTAPALNGIGAALYPFKKRGTIDVHGGHHDAGDYSKYLINSAQLVHSLVFAVDNFAGVASLDNLGLPESGDGRSDLLQLAKWEADFIARAQDSDGGFYFLVYPRDEKYEWNVLPDHGAPQVVFPKNTGGSAACTAALAQIASSPAFRRSFPDDAARYLKQARAGFAFLEGAWAAHGRRGAWQKITHYGIEFQDRDEIAWAETEMFLATGESHYEKLMLADLHPDDPSTLRWSWWRLFEGYGCAERDLAFAAHNGRVGHAPSELVEQCRRQVLQCGQEQVAWARACAYGTSFPVVDKRYGNAAWYFGGAHAFDAAAAFALDPRAEYLEAMIGNFNFDHGTNPQNITFVTGMGWKRQLEIVNQYAKNDRRVLPPSGIPLGSLTQVEPYLGTYGGRLRELVVPPDDDRRNPYPLYDRWTDTWNVQSECVTATQARCLAAAALLMARSPQAHQAWRSAPATITLTAARGRGTMTATLTCKGLDLTKASRIVWERNGADPVFGGPTLTFTPGGGSFWVEAEIQWPDGRRAFAAAQ